LICCCGELLVDVAADGFEWPGGAPANVAFHAAQAGITSCLVSRTGQDVRAERLRRWLMEEGIEAGAVTSGAPDDTGVVHVARGSDGPVYDIIAPAAWDFLEASPAAVTAARRAHVCVCGTLAQRHPVARTTLRSLAAAAREGGATVLVDLNLRPPFVDDEVVLWGLRNAEVLRLTEVELAMVSGILGARGRREELFRGLLGEFGIAKAVLTAGKEGAWFHAGGVTWHQPAVPGKVVDTVGCGDAVTALVAAALARGRTLREVAPFCMEVAGYVATQRGATPRWPVVLSERVRLALSAQD